MAIEEGSKVSGTVSGITNFGAFVDLEDNQTGLVHISQISYSFVKDIHDVLAVGDQVEAKVVKVAPDGKIALSMKAIEEAPAAKHIAKVEREHGHDHRDHGEGRHYGRDSRPARGGYGNHHGHKQSGDFNAMLASFMKESDSRLSTLKRQTDGKRGGRGGRRS